MMSRCGEDVRNLERFTNAQRTAFQKILKKYKVGQNTLGIEFDKLTIPEMDWIP